MRIEAVASAVCVLLATGAVRAEPDCDALPNPLYLQVGDTQEPLLKALGQKLRESTANPMTLIYVTSGSCTNIEAMYTGVKITTNPKYVPSAAEDGAWTPALPSPTCIIDAEGHDVEVANSALFVSACDASDPPAGIHLFEGPKQAYVFVVPEASTQTALTAEEGYFVFGFGQSGQVTPWDDETLMFIRPVTKSTLLTLAAHIGVPAASWKGVRLDKSSEVLNAVATSTTPEKTIGILGAEIYDGNRATVNALAFQAFHQNYAYYADSTSTAFDKQNLRDGHYLPWSPTVWLTHVDDAGVPTNANAKYFIDLLLDQPATPTPDFNPLEVVIAKGLVPECAMHVSRTYEGGDLALFAADAPCDCYYASRVGTAPASCLSCTDDTPCGSGHCRHGFCEAR